MNVFIFDKAWTYTKVTDSVLQYDFDKTIKDGKFIQTGSLNKPPAVLMKVASASSEEREHHPAAD